MNDFVEDRLNLSLNEQKTSLSHAEDEGIGFLGYRIEPVHPKKGGGAKKVIPREAIKDVKSALRRRCGEDAPTDLSVRNRIQGVNSVLRGWAGYYKYSTRASKPFTEVDGFAWKKLSRWLAKKHRCSRRALFARAGVGISPITMKGKQMVDIKTMCDARWEESKEKPHPYFDGTVKRTQPTATYRFYENEHSLNHRDLKWEVFQRDDFTCQECGAGVSWHDNGELHHLEYSGKTVDAETLCASCHAEKDPHRYL